MKRFKCLKIFTALASLALFSAGFAGCSDISAAAEHAASETIAYGRVAFTVPDSVTLTDITFKGTKDDTGKTTEFGTWETASELTDAEIKIPVGTYTFYLSATYEGDTVSGSTNGTIKENEETPLSFTLTREAIDIPLADDEEGEAKVVGTVVATGPYAGKYLVMDWDATAYKYTSETSSVEVTGSYPDAETFLASDMSTGQVAILGGAKSKYDTVSGTCPYIQLSAQGSTSKGLKFDVPINTNYIVLRCKVGSSGKETVGIAVALSDGSAAEQKVPLNAPNSGEYVYQEFAYSLTASEDETQKSIIIYNAEGKNGNALNIKKIQVYAETPWNRAQKATSSKTVAENEDVYKETGSVTVDMTVTTEATSTGSLDIKKAEGWLNSMYVIFTDTASSYTITCDEKPVDNELIRHYSTYTYHTNSYNDGQTTWTKDSYAKVVRVDVLGLTAGEHTISITPQGGTATTVTATVLNQDRSGYAFSDSIVPGAYNKDGSLKSNAKVLYVTKENAKTISLDITDKKGVTTSYQGLQNILRNSTLKNSASDFSLDIRIIGKLSLNDLDGIDSSAEGLQIKNNYNGSKNYVPITIEGVGHDATIWGFGFLIRDSKYIEMANLGIMCFLDDGISLDTNNLYTWVHNIDLFYGSAGGDSDQAKGDGSLDVKGKSTMQSYSYLHFWDSGKSSLCGMKSEAESNRLTYHHNWFDHSDSRHPRIRTSTVHVYNNYFDGNAKYGPGVTMGASAFVEQNIFRNPHDPMMSSGQGTDATGNGTFSGETGGWIKAYNNMFFQLGENGVKFQYMTNKDADWTSDDNDIDSYIVDNREDPVPALKAVSGGATYNNFDTKEELYLAEGSLTEPATALSNVVKFAGRHNPDFAWTFQNADEDKNYAVISALKSALVAYQNTGLKKVGQ